VPFPLLRASALCFAAMSRQRIRVAAALPCLVALIFLFAGAGGAQTGPAGQRAAAGTALETIQIRPNVYVIFGAGGNITVHVGEDGPLLVDSGTDAAAERVIQAVRAITPRPIRLIVNTSADLDHAGGNDKVARTGQRLNPDSFSDEEQATILAHENVLARMSTPVGDNTPFPTGAWPTETYSSRVRGMYLNDDGVQLIRQLGAHSDGDTMVLFRRADVIATGDVLDLRQFPVIDAAIGGSIQGELEALNKLLELTIPAMPLVYKEGRTLLVPGHGRIADYSELVEYRDMVTIIRDIIQDMKAKGMSVAQVKAADPARGWRKRFGSDTGPWTTDMFVEAVYNGVPAEKQGS
jgi:cyclase